MLVKGNISISLWSKSLMQFCSYFDDILLILLIAHLNTNWARDMLVLTFDWDKSIHSSWIWKLKINKCFVNKLQEILTQMIADMISIKTDKYIQVAPTLTTIPACLWIQNFQIWLGNTVRPPETGESPYYKPHRN